MKNIYLAILTVLLSGDLCTIPAMAEPDRELISSGHLH
jgi:hypothetical protein